MPPLQSRYSHDVVRGYPEDNVLEIAVVRVVDRPGVPADIPRAIGSSIHITVKAGRGDPLNRGKPVHIIDLVTRHLVVVHHFGGSPQLILINAGKGEAVPIMRPSLAGGFVQVTLLVDIVLA